MNSRAPAGQGFLPAVSELAAFRPEVIVNIDESGLALPAKRYADKPVVFAQEDVAVGRVTRKIATQEKRSPVITGTLALSLVASRISQLTRSSRQASHLARFGTARCSRQARNGGPKCG